MKSVSTRYVRCSCARLIDMHAQRLQRLQRTRGTATKVAYHRGYIDALLTMQKRLAALAS